MNRLIRIESFSKSLLEEGGPSVPMVPGWMGREVFFRNNNTPPPDRNTLSEYSPQGESFGSETVFQSSFVSKEGRHD